MISDRAMESGIEEDNCIPYTEWLKVGRDRMIVFDQTMAEAEAKRQGSAPVPLYTNTKGYRLVDLFPKR